MMLSKAPLDNVPGLEHPFVQLLLSFLCDGIGMATYLLPVLGELGDLVWAPLQAMYIAGMVGLNKSGLFFAALGFTEEILPFTDFVPSCSIGWFFAYVQKYVRR